MNRERRDKAWRIRPIEGSAARRIADEAGISLPLASILLGRGLAKNAHEARRFLKPDVQSLPNPFLLADMDRAVELTRRALRERWPILVHGDRDVDGVSAASLLYRVLRELGGEVDVYVPMEVYGIVAETLEDAAARGVRLVITADCGTTAHGPILRARELGMEVIVLDHHQPEGELPPASALINPNRADCSYENKLLSGSGVSFKFAWALYLSMEPEFDEEIVVVDLETTGLSPESCEIVEMAAVRFRRGLELDSFQSLVRPLGPVPPEAVRVHGLDEQALAGSPTLEDVLPRFLHFLGSSPIVAHNAAFDLAFLQRASARVLGTGLPNPAICTLEKARRLVPGQASYSLGSLCRHFELAAEQPHRALSDARSAGQLYYQLLRLQSRARRGEFYKKYLGDLTLGTLADVVPVLGENRVLCHFGLKMLRLDERPGVQALLDAMPSAGERLTSRDITFGIAPLLNAAGRAGQADLSLRLLLTDSAKEALQILAEMQRLREEGRAHAQEMTAALRRLLAEQSDLARDRVLVVVTSEHKRGVTGVVANRLMEEFGRPLVLLIDDEQGIRGSARAPEGFDILELLRAVSSELDRFGGHRQAAGLTVQPQRVEAFRKAINAAAEEVYGDRAVVAELLVDLEMGVEEISEALLQEFAQLEPFGMGNPAPVLSLREVRPRRIRKIGKEEQHLRLDLGPDMLQAMGWNFAGRVREDGEPEALDLVFHLESNEFQGRRSIRLNLLDLRQASGP